MGFLRYAPMACLFLALTSTQNAHAVTKFITSPFENWAALLSNPSYLSPGDEVVFSAGTYSTTSRVGIGFVGTAANPITIRAAEGAHVVLTRPNAAQNTINIEGSQYLTLKGFDITGGSAGVRIGQKNGVQAKFVTLENNHIHHTGGGAVTANFNGQTYEGLRFVGNEIDHTGAEGEGFYLGCNNNACQFYDGIIENNYIHHLNGPTVTQGDGIEIKDGSYNNIVRDNVIHDTNFPGVLVYGVEEQGARNVIERNVIWNAGDHAIQAAADAVIRNNIIFSSTFDGIYSRNHQGAVSGNLTIVNNTVRAGLSAIRVVTPGGGALSGPIEIANNALYPGGGFAINQPSASVTGLTYSSNVGTGVTSQGLPSSAFDNSGNLTNDFINFLAQNAFPKVGSALIGAADAAYLPTDDFNLSTRGGSLDVGAYLYAAAGNPGWQIAEAFKQFLAASAPGDANGDGVVDLLDLDILGTNFGASPATFAQGDFNGDNVVDLLDLDILGTNFGNGSSNAVPEPGSLFLLTLGFASLLTPRQRLRRR